MNRTITYPITENDHGVKIQHFLRRRGYSRQSLIELKKTEGSVTVNDVPRHFNERLFPGDILAIRITDEDVSGVPAVELPVDIIYEDEDILVVNKPAGMPTHPSFKNTRNTLANALAWHYGQLGIPFSFRCSNRLDRDTSGLTIVSRHYVSAAIISEMGARREISREYLAIVRGVPDPPEGTIDAPLGRKDSSIIERCVDYENGERAVTHYRTLRTVPDPCAGDGAARLSLAAITLGTGRTHQIRVHMQYIGHPLIGDYLYDPAFDENTPQPIGRQALHAYRLRFAHPITGAPMSFTAPLPADMRAVLSGSCLP